MFKINQFYKKILISLFVLFVIPVLGFAKVGLSPYKILQDPQGVYIVLINTTRAKDNLIPYYVNDLKTNKEVYEETGARLVVNAGFFDPKNKKTVSYLTQNGMVALNPRNNSNLMNNEALQPYIEKILNRSEFRILEDENGKLSYDIAPHNQKIKEGLTIKHSIQGGPMLLPNLRLEEEFFVLRRNGKIISESASALHKYARTAIGLRDGNVYLFIITKDNPMTLEGVANLAKSWGMEKAMAFDGGGSTSFDSQELHIISDKDDTARRLKSFLILK